jgi:hypothetical protein
MLKLFTILFRLPFPSYCDVAQARNYFASAVRSSGGDPTSNVPQGLRVGGEQILIVKFQHITKFCTEPRTWTDSLDRLRMFENSVMRRIFGHRS